MERGAGGGLCDRAPVAACAPIVRRALAARWSVHRARVAQVAQSRAVPKDLASLLARPERLPAGASVLLAADALDARLSDEAEKARRVCPTAEASKVGAVAAAVS